MRLYDSAISGNSYKVRLVAAQLGRPLEIVPVDILRGESRTGHIAQQELPESDRIAPGLERSPESRAISRLAAGA